MKINIVTQHDPADSRNGYVNIGRHLTGSPDPLKINDVIKDGEAEEIVTGFFLQEVTPDQIPTMLEVFHRKLKTQGRLFISFFDIHLVCNKGQTRTFTLENLHSAVFGPNFSHRGVMDIATMTSLLRAAKFKIEAITVTPNGVIATIEASVAP